MKKIFNRFEWNKIVCKSLEELKSKFPANHLVGKKIKSLNAIGSIEELGKTYIGFLRNDEWMEGNQQEIKNLSCSFSLNESFVIIFDDDSTFEIQLLEEKIYRFSENQISAETTDGLNHCEINASFLFAELIGSVIKNVQLDKEILFETDSGFSLKISFRDSNHTLYELLKNGENLQKKLSDCLKSLENVEQIEIQERHNTSSYFWIESATELDSYEKGEFGVDYAFDAEISIEEDYVYDYLAVFLKKYYKPENHKICRSDDNKYFEWNLEPNLYKYSDVEKMLSKIKETCRILKADFDDKRLDEWKKYSIGTSFINEEIRQERINFVESRVEIIIDFYERFCFQIEEMMKRYPNYECIDFMGP